MGLGDTFKDLAKQAQGAVAEHKDQIRETVDAVGVAADRKTGGKHTAKIAKMGQTANDAIDKFGADDDRQGSGQPGSEE
jgi:hypothetical protein